MKVTIKDISEVAGVSASTVSLVLNNRPGISEETRKAVLDASKKLGYDTSGINHTKPVNDIIRFLKIAQHGHMVNEDHGVFIADYIEGIDRQARKKDYVLEVVNYSNFDVKEIKENLKKRPPAGIIVLATEFDHSDIAQFNDIACPIVFIDSSLPFCTYDFVDMDNEGAVFSVVSTLVQNGHSKIGLVKSSALARNFILRERSFYDALGFYNIELVEEYTYCVDSTLESSFEDMDKQLGEKRNLPTAFFCVCDIIAFGVMKALKKHGYNIPEDISIIGFDNLPQSTVTDPPLTSVKVSKVRIGEKAFDLLENRIQEHEKTSYEKVYVGSELVIRESLKENK